MSLEAVSKLRPARPDRFECFFRGHYAELTRVAWGIVRDAHLAEDVAQEVMLAIRRRFPELDDPTHAIGWARTATVHTALNLLRSRRRSQDRDQRASAGGEIGGPEEVVMARAEEARVRAALSRLPLHAATVLVLRHSGLSYAEIARTMEVKVGHVGTMLRRAESALRKEVERGTRA